MKSAKKERGDNSYLKRCLGMGKLFYIFLGEVEQVSGRKKTICVLFRPSKNFAGL